MEGRDLDMFNKRPAALRMMPRRGRERTFAGCNACIDQRRLGCLSDSRMENRADACDILCRVETAERLRARRA